MCKEMFSDDYLEDPDNWWDFGLTDYFEDEKKFKDFLEIASEGARIIDLVLDYKRDEGEESVIYHLLLTLCAASASLGFICEECEETSPLVGQRVLCKKCKDKGKT